MAVQCMINQPLCTSSLPMHRCVLVEQKPLTVAQFKAVALEEARLLSSAKAHHAQPAASSGGEATPAAEEPSSSTGAPAPARRSLRGGNARGGDGGYAAALVELPAGGVPSGGSSAPATPNSYRSSPSSGSAPPQHVSVQRARQGPGSNGSGQQGPGSGGGGAGDKPAAVVDVGERAFWASVTLNPPL